MVEELVIKNANNVAVTTSLKLAEKFRKTHKSVMRVIKRVIEESAQGCAGQSPMFEKSSYIDKGNRTQPMYIMNRDGYTLVAMSFIGAEAMKFKLDYINAFNKMESYIKEERGNRLPEPVTALQALAQQAQFLARSVEKMAEIEQKQIEAEMKTKALESRLDTIDAERKRNTEELLGSELSDETAPDMTERRKVVMLVNKYCVANNIQQQDMWHRVYKDLYYKYGISINGYRKEKNESKLDVAERHGFLHQIYNIVSDLVRMMKK